MSVPAVVIAAPASGSGKTTVATGLLGALRAAGRTPAPFKVGPDYVDPGYHALAAGRPGRNLDPVMVGEDLVGPLYAHGGAGCDVAVVEGVMGLFDGRTGTQGFGSTAHVAELLGAPVVLVVDARGQAGSLAALLHGFATYRPGTRLAGVVLNRVGSPRHEQVLRAACEEVGLAVLGVLPRHDGLAVPSRHLGLVTAVEHGAAAVDAVAAMTALVRGHVDVEAVLALAASSVTAAPWAPEVAVTPGRPVVAVAGGAAFTFGYAEHVELLAAAGADVVTVDPSRDEVLPEGTHGLVLPGGFPEEHAATLAANTRLLEQVRALALHAPVHAECGGLLYLARELEGHRLAGVLDATATFGPRLALGYRDAVALGDSVLHPAGARVTGHEFHRTVLTPGAGATPAWAWTGTTEGFVQDQVHASYLHTHPAAAPGSVARFVAACAA
ncbi:cobyrinate a,c-diamide synthase [Rhodococcus antarcticus]|uniref:cobyrinate a,c-diamide synthase n=1 Tax=Rhodococcus antarcticus TaxID=2987751 RepID=UPI003F49B131